MVIEPRPVTLVRELPGRVTPVRVAEVRARVDGIVEKRLFTEGSDVKEGEVLYQIEAAPYEAQLAAARAELARAEATLVRVRLAAERNEKLVKSNAVSREEQEDSAAALRAAEAEVAARRAAVKMARIQLDYTKVRAPVAGRIGRSEVTEGAYVRQAEGTMMTTIQQLDSVYVDITQSAAELLRLRRELEAERLQRGEGGTKVTLILEDGQVYDEVGTLQFADATVGESTGSVTLRALFPNPRKELLPGMFVRAKLEQGTNPRAILVPQRAVARDQRGVATVLVVGADDKVERREIVAERALGDHWLVTEGLSEGDRVIVDGLQKARPGEAVVVVDGSTEPTQ